MGQNGMQMPNLQFTGQNNLAIQQAMQMLQQQMGQ